MPRLFGSSLVLLIVICGRIFACKAYVALVHFPKLVVIDTSTHSVVSTIDNVGTTQINFELASPNRTRIYVASDIAPGIVSVIDSSSDMIIGSIPVGNFPSWLAITPDGSKLYSTNQASNSVSVINTTTNAVVKTISGITNPSVISISLDGSAAYVTSSTSPSVAIIDTSIDTVINTISITSIPFHMTVTPDGKKVFIVNRANSIDVLHTVNNMVTNIPIVSSPAPAAFPTSVMIMSPDGSKIYVTNGNSARSVTVIDVATESIVNTIPIPTPLNNLVNGIAISSDGSTVYVTSDKAGTSGYLSVIDTASNTVTRSIVLSAMMGRSSADSVMIDPEQTNLVVNNPLGGTFVDIVKITPPRRGFSLTPLTDDNFMVAYGP